MPLELPRKQETATATICAQSLRNKRNEAFANM